MTHTNRPAHRERLLFAAVAALGVGLLASVRRVQVEGESMRPALDPGDRLLLVPVTRPRRGDLVGVRDPREPHRLLVKRVTAIEASGYVVTGDNPDASTDGRHFGPVARRDLRGRAVYRYAPPERSGRLRRGRM